jgi:hypothetical protein
VKIQGADLGDLAGRLPLQQVADPGLGGRHLRLGLLDCRLGAGGSRRRLAGGGLQSRRGRALGQLGGGRVARPVRVVQVTLAVSSAVSAWKSFSRIVFFSSLFLGANSAMASNGRRITCTCLAISVSMGAGCPASALPARAPSSNRIASSSSSDSGVCEGLPSAPWAAAEGGFSLEWRRRSAESG